MTTLNENFNKLKPEFRKLYGKDWNEEPALYTAFVQLAYTDTLNNNLKTWLNQMMNEQERASQELRHIASLLRKEG